MELQCHITKVICLVSVLCVVCLNFPVTQAAIVREQSKLDTVRHPIVLVPGDGGSRFLAKLNKTSGVHYWCYQHTSDYYLLWLNLDLIIGKFMDCFIDNMQLHWNSKDRKTYNTDGVDIQIDSFGKTEAVENLSDWNYWFSSYTLYFYNLVELLVKKLGYTRNQDIFAAPYDFRKAPNELQPFFQNLTKLTEQAYYANNNTRVVLVAHSYGCALTLHWLHAQSQQWKDKFIEHFVSLAGPYGGTALGYQVYAAGYNLDVWELSALRLRQEQRTSPSLAFLMPNPAVWPADSVFASVGNQTTYGFQNQQQFFTDIGYEAAWEMRKDTQGLLDVTKPPGVSMYCVFGNSTATTLKVVYKDNSTFPDTPTTVVKDWGDGTVNLNSLRWCESWKGKQKQPFQSKLYQYVDHMGLVTNATVAEDIVDHIGEVNAGRHLNML